MSVVVNVTPDSGVSIILIPSGELKEAKVARVAEIIGEGLNNPNSLRGVESFHSVVADSDSYMVSIILIPSGELKVSLRDAPMSCAA